MDEKELIQRLTRLIEVEKESEILSERNEKLKKILLLLAKGAMLATVIAMPGTVRLFKDFARDKSEWDDWKAFNQNYLRRTIRKLEARKLIEIEDHGDWGEVKLLENGRKKVLKLALESVRINKPDHWDGKWRLVFYDVFDDQKNLREKFRHYLKSAGFYPLQKSVYIHAYPCEKEIEFFKYYLGISGAVRMVIAEKIENDQEFRDYFDIN